MVETTLISVRIPKDVAKRLAELAGIAEANAGKLMRHEEAVKRIKRWGSRGA
jgi:predicted transcriptional regulator